MPVAVRDIADLSRTALRQRIGDGHLVRFHETLERLGCFKQRLGVAVSGGPDSMALLLLCAAYEWPDGFSVATVDHGLRPESSAEAAHVAAFCEMLGIPHATLAVTVQPGRGGIQARARAARYAALADWIPGGRLLTAHHRDDVAETLLMRLARGSGVRGLARMAETMPLRRGGTVLHRPLLDWSKAELLDVCARVGVTGIKDPSNTDPRHDRTAVRTLLARAPWVRPAMLARSARNLDEADAALRWLADLCWTRNVAQDDAGFTFAPDDLPHDTRRRIVERILVALDGPDPDRRVDTMVRYLSAGDHAMLGDVQAIPGDRWTFRRAPPRRAPNGA